MKKLNSAFDYGFAYAKAMQGEQGFNEPVDIEKMVHNSQDIPDGDYTAMTDAGIEPNAREYWKGFNSFFKN